MLNLRVTYSDAVMDVGVLLIHGNQACEVITSPVKISMLGGIIARGILVNRDDHVSSSDLAS